MSSLWGRLCSSPSPSWYSLLSTSDMMLCGTSEGRSTCTVAADLCVSNLWSVVQPSDPAFNDQVNIHSIGPLDEIVLLVFHPLKQA